MHGSWGGLPSSGAAAPRFSQREKDFATCFLANLASSASKEGIKPLARLSAKWRRYFFKIRSLAEKCRADESDNPLYVREFTFVSINRGLN